MRDTQNDLDPNTNAIAKAICAHGNLIADNLVHLKKFIDAQNRYAEEATKEAAIAAQKSAQAARSSMFATWVLASLALIQILVEMTKQ